MAKSITPSGRNRRRFLQEAAAATAVAGIAPSIILAPRSANAKLALDNVHLEAAK
jgi:hypothetical protein